MFRERKVKKFVAEKSKIKNVRNGNRKFDNKKIRTGKMAENPKEKNCLLVNLFCDWVL